MRPSISRLFVGVLAAPLMLLSSTALADDPCGKFVFDGSMSCEVRVEGGCTAECTPVNFNLACEGQCEATVGVSCNVDCSGECSASCEVDPGSFECSVDCEATCGASCESHCSSSSDGTNCKSQCQAGCKSDCSAECTATPPTATCEAKCEASCKGSCSAEAQIDCHVGCEADLQGGCEVQCKEPSGAIFCNGQYVDATDIDSCITHLADNFSIDVSADARCTADGCEAVASCNACSTANAANSRLNLSALGVVALGVTAMVARRRRRA